MRGISTATTTATIIPITKGVKNPPCEEAPSAVTMNCVVAWLPVAPSYADMAYVPAAMVGTVNWVLMLPNPSA